MLAIRHCKDSEYEWKDKAPALNVEQGGAYNFVGNFDVVNINPVTHKIVCL